MFVAGLHPTPSFEEKEGKLLQFSLILGFQFLLGARISPPQKEEYLD